LASARFATSLSVKSGISLIIYLIAVDKERAVVSGDLLLLVKLVLSKVFSYRRFERDQKQRVVVWCRSTLPRRLVLGRTRKSDSNLPPRKSYAIARHPGT